MKFYPHEKGAEKVSALLKEGGAQNVVTRELKVLPCLECVWRGGGTNSFGHTIFPISPPSPLLMTSP